MNSRILKIGAAVYEPLTYLCSLETLNPTSTCSFPGSHAEVLGYLLRLAGIQYKLVPFRNTPIDWGQPDGNGSWSGLLGLIKNGTIDTISSYYSQIPRRLTDFSFSYEFERVNTVFFINLDTATSPDTAKLVYQVFTPTLWSFILATIVAFGFSTVFMNQLSSQARHTASDSVWLCLRLCLDQFDEHHSATTFPSTFFYFCLGFLNIIILPLHRTC